MNDKSPNHPALLPAGLRDTLPPEAELEAKSVEAIMDCFAAHGYQRVKTPLLEFEESLFAGAGAATIEHTFRLMDPESQRMMGVRADITPQISRLAASRLSEAPRPLRLAYSGQCLRSRGSHLHAERQLAQAGIELIGADSAAADAEIMLTAAEALAGIGLKNISFDLTFPRLARTLLEGFDAISSGEISHALDRKDHAAVADAGGPVAHLLLQLLEASGPVHEAIPALLAIKLPDAARGYALRIAETVAAVQKSNPALTLTSDPVEFRGYRYHTGLCFTVFGTGEQAELGRGGRYLTGELEPATGISLYPDTIVRIAPPPLLRPRIYLQYGTSAEIASACRAQNFATVAALSVADDPASEASRLGCTHFYHNNEIILVSGGAKK
jgi:ATP phosphoribosyltransferase regulatory subunit